MKQIANNSPEQAMLGDFIKVIDDSIMYSSDAHQNQMMSLLPDPARSAHFSRLYLIYYWQNDRLRNCSFNHQTGRFQGMVEYRKYAKRPDTRSIVKRVMRIFEAHDIPEYEFLKCFLNLTFK